MKQLKLKNYLIYLKPKVKTLPVFLDGLLLHGKESRARSRFLKLLIDKTVEIDNERKNMILEVCKKNSKGEPVFICDETEEKDGKSITTEKETTDETKAKKYAFANPKDEDDFNKEWQEFLNEYFIIDVLPSNSEVIYIVKDLILNVKQEFMGEEADQYNEWCDAFESISEIREVKKIKK